MKSESKDCKCAICGERALMSIEERGVPLFYCGDHAMDRVAVRMWPTPQARQAVDDLEASMIDPVPVQSREPFEEP